MELNRQKKLSIIAAIITLTATITALAGQMPHKFKDGEKAFAEQINDNFGFLEDKINDATYERASRASVDISHDVLLGDIKIGTILVHFQNLTASGFYPIMLHNDYENIYPLRNSLNLMIFHVSNFNIIFQNGDCSPVGSIYFINSSSLTYFLIRNPKRLFSSHKLENSPRMTLYSEKTPKVYDTLPADFVPQSILRYGSCSSLPSLDYFNPENSNNKYIKAYNYYENASDIDQDLPWFENIDLMGGKIRVDNNKLIVEPGVAPR